MRNMQSSISWQYTVRTMILPITFIVIIRNCVFSFYYILPLSRSDNELSECSLKVIVGCLSAECVWSLTAC